MPGWVTTLQVHIYLLLMNRLYLDALMMRLGRLFRREIDRLNGRRMFTYIAALIAIGAALGFAAPLPALEAAQIALLILIAILLPLFPLHGIYVAALTRLTDYQAVAVALLMPAAGFFGLANLLPELPTEALRFVRVLALFGAVYGSLKALGEIRVPQLLAYAGVAFFSALWWSFGVTGTFAVQPITYCVATILVVAGFLLAWQRVDRQYGALTLDRMHGLAWPMPRFATVLSLLVMVAAGLFPFGLFSAYMAMWLQAPITLSWELMVLLFTWFLASWYLFRMMQRLLFGPHRPDIPYEDLRRNEVAGFALLLLILVALGAMPPQWLQANLPTRPSNAMEMTPWRK
jgi:NADH:ubiquinone oxidoreductase subunit 4 (subunit M)